jgi:hypothetical protein
LAAAAVDGDRVTGVGVASGAGPFELVPNALDELSDSDKNAYSHLPADPEAAALGFASGFEQLAQMLRNGDDVLCCFGTVSKTSWLPRLMGNGSKRISSTRR